jgi:hypothetical protein
MPMIVDPSAPLVTPPEVVVSADGWLSAAVDGPWAGVALAYNAATPPSTRNLVYNPSTEVDLTNTLTYAGATRTRITTDSAFGSACLQITSTAATSGNQYLCSAIPAGTVIRVSAYVKVPAGGSTIFFAFRDSATTHNVVTAGTPVTGQWSRMTVAYTVPAGKTVDRIAVAFTAPVGTVWLADAMQVETGVTEPSPYIDGSLPDGAWEGAPHASPSVRVTALPDVDQVRKVLIVRQDPGRDPVPVRSADSAWAVGGAGSAYDHEAPLGVGVVYSARPQFADGSWGPASSLALALPNPTIPMDVWIKSLDEPGLSTRVVVRSWPALTWAANIDTAAVDSSRFPAAAQGAYSASSSDIVIDADGTDIERLEKLLTTPGVRLIQARSDSHRRDMFVLFGDVQQTMDGRPGESRGYAASVLEVARPDTADQPLRIPGWSFDALAAQHATFNSVTASYPTFRSLAVRGMI